jgi:UDP-glucose 4-epimerase
MAILVTGGAGYIGSHTCVELLNAGYEIIVLDNFINSTPEVLSRIKAITGRDFKTCCADLLDVAQIDRVFTENHIDAVIHFAGLKESSHTPNIPLSYYYNNITSTIFLCELMKKHNVKKLVFSSSAVVYELPSQGAISEETPLWTLNTYGRTKIMIEELLKDLYLTDPNWSIAILRYFSPFGAHKSGLIGENQAGFSGYKLSDGIRVVYEKMQELRVLGNEYSPKEGTAVRDYIHVTDLAAGHVRALEKVLKAPCMETYNLGTGKSCSRLEVLSAFENAAGVKLPFHLADSCLNEQGVCFVDPSKANKDLNWCALNGIQEMAEDWWRWIVKNPNGYQEPINSKVEFSK